METALKLIYAAGPVRDDSWINDTEFSNKVTVPFIELRVPDRKIVIKLWADDETGTKGTKRLLGTEEYVQVRDAIHIQELCTNPYGCRLPRFSAELA